MREMGQILYPCIGQTRLGNWRGERLVPSVQKPSDNVSRKLAIYYIASQKYCAIFA